MKRVERLPRSPQDGGGFFPQQRERQAVLEQTIHRSPETFGIARSRWTLPLLRKHCPPLWDIGTDSGVWRRLKKWRIRLKQGRPKLSSPDPDYAAKVTVIEQMLSLARQFPSGVSLLYADEMSFYRQPVAGRAWHQKGKTQATAPLSPAANARHRILGALDAVTGEVVSVSNSKIGLRALCRFLQQVRKAYDPERRIVLVWDNWPVHKHETLRKEAANQRIELLFLPTYAPWTNPIEKLWRKLKQEVLALHRHSGDWSYLKQQADDFLSHFHKPSQHLLRYVGLLPLLSD